MKLPIYQLVINEEDETGVDYVALVDYPAIEKNFIAFDKQREQFTIDNEDERVVSGALMLAGLPIYRRDSKRGEYYCIFTAETIKKICVKFHKNQFAHNTNLMHDPKQRNEGVFMFESWIVDRSKGKMPLSNDSDAADGSWFGSFKVLNDDVWRSVKDGTFKGFSVEGIFDSHSNALGEKEMQVLQAIQSLRDAIFKK